MGQLRGLRLRLLRGLRLRRGLLLRDRRGRPALQDRLQRRRGHVLSVHLELPIGHRGIVRQQPQRFQAVQRRLQLTYGAGAAVHRHIAAGQRPGLRDGQGAALLLNGDLAAPVGEHVAVLVDEAILPQQLHGLLGGLFISPERGQLPQDLLILVGRVVPQGGVGRRGQGAHEHDGGHEPRQPAFPSFSHKTLPSIAYTGVLMPCTVCQHRGGALQGADLVRIDRGAVVAADKAAGQDALQLRNSAPKLQRPGPPLRVNEDFVPASPEPEDLAQLDHARFPTGQRHPKRLPAVSAAAKPQDFLQPLPLRRHHQAPLHGQAVAVQYLLIVIHQKDNRQGIGFRLKFTGQLHPAVGGLQK